MPERKIPRAILFDWDNTLVESWGVIHEAMNLTLAAMGHPHWTREETRDAGARLPARFIPEHVRRPLAGRGAGLLQRFAAIHLQHLRALPGAGEMLADLAVRASISASSATSAANTCGARPITWAGPGTSARWPAPAMPPATSPRSSM